jgi:hypothetical protein
MPTKWLQLQLIEEILDGLEEARRRVGIKRFRNIRLMRRVRTKKKGLGKALLRKVRKMHHAIRKGPMHNRHRT